ncbi:MAG: transporter [Vicinamibacteria bacterium]|nr:transporter [Vicinamibacteria bacterium]
MRRAVLIGSLVALGWLSLPAAAGVPETCTVTRDGVRTWIIEIDGEECEARPLTPSIDGSTGLFHMSTAYTLPRKKMAFSLFYDNMDRDPKDEDIGIFGLNAAFGATDRLELFGNFGLQNRVDADALFQPGYSNEYPFVATPWETGAGDLKLGLKYKLLDDYMGDGVGLAVRSFVKFGTADQEKGLGTGKGAFGVDLLVSKSLNRKADLHASLGYQWNSDPDEPYAIDLGNAFKWGVGLNIPACRVFQVQAEVTGSSYSDGDFEQTNPIDLVVGPVFWIKGFFLRPAYTRNLNFDDRGLNQGIQSSQGFQFSIGFHPGAACCKFDKPAPAPPPPMSNRAPTASCEVERATIAVGENVGLRAVASDADGDGLNYTWTTTTGTITGTGANVRLDSKGVAAPATLTANLRVSDGRGGIADAVCTVRIPAPEKRPETFTCDSTGFPLNRARLNNIDKACLDDVAARLRQDPRSRVIVIGHADAAERRPDLLARQRGEAAKTYLVGERGIEEARVAVRTAPVERSTDAASARKHRRVEVIFVPAGAVPPGE